MHKKRIIFTLLYSDGDFMMSRNFSLHKIGDLNWLLENYRFSDFSHAIDELIILDVGREQRNIVKFTDCLRKLTKNIFIPVAVGGGINSLSSAETVLHSGADKLVINTILHADKELVRELSRKYGAQCLIGSIDFRVNDSQLEIYVDNGTHMIDKTLDEYISEIQELGVGEVYLNSIDRDGTGHGYALDAISSSLHHPEIPVILAGGAGNHTHLLEGICTNGVEAVATANLLNFVGDGLEKSREVLKQHNIELASW